MNKMEKTQEDKSVVNPDWILNSTLRMLVEQGVELDWSMQKMEWILRIKEVQLQERIASMLLEHFKRESK